MDLHDRGRDYQAPELHFQDLLANPFDQFAKWFEQAEAAGEKEANAVALATVDAHGQPKCRMVLLKYVNEEGFVFFSNYQSAKGVQLTHNPKAALTFWWQTTEQQVRLEGVVHRLPEQASDEYFATRDRLSQLAAWASPQSQELASRQALLARFADCQQQYPEDQVIPRPTHWGGYVLQPEQFEFWRGRSHRMHDRFVYRRDDSGGWQRQRLAP